MPVIIKKIADDKVEVGGKPVFKDMNGNWIAQLPLTNFEKRDMYQFLENHNIT